MGGQSGLPQGGRAGRLLGRQVRRLRAPSAALSLGVGAASVLTGPLSPGLGPSPAEPKGCSCLEG